VRRLVEVLETVELREPGDALALVPDAVRDGPFTTRELARALRCGRQLAGRANYCLRALDLVEPAGRRDRSPLYRVAA
jgi:hypothetical protein